jgi:predicted TIM-barrel fold metal-dependent hydrolase
VRETIARVLRSYGLSPRGAGAEAAIPAAPAVIHGVTDADFNVKAWHGEGRALYRRGLHRIVISELPQELQEGDASTESISVRAVIAPPARDDRVALQQLHDRGVRALRFRLDAACDPHAILGWTERIVPLGWHVEIELPDAANAPRLADAEWVLLQVPVATCFSGLAGFLAAREAESAFVLELVAMGRFWLKLSGAEIARAKQPTREALQRFVTAAMAVRGDRLVWGSGASAPGEDLPAHIDAGIEALRQWLPDSASRSRVLWSNPAALYRF